MVLIVKAKAQGPDKFQPDSIYKILKVKRIYVYENSPKDISQVIDLDTNGHKIKIVSYSASYDRATRARKGIASVSRYVYDNEGKLTDVIDSAAYVKSSDDTDHTTFFYDSKGVLKNSIYYKRNYVYSKTDYDTNPFKSYTTRRNDSLIIQRDTEEYDKDFYRKRSYGYSWEPTLKTERSINGRDTSIYQYSDYKDLKKLYSFEETANRFNFKGQLITSYINQWFMVRENTWRTAEITLTFDYYPNALLRGIYGYVPEYFKYEFFK